MFWGPLSSKREFYKMNVWLYASLNRKLLDLVPPNSQQTYQVGHTCTEKAAYNGPNDRRISEAARRTLAGGDAVRAVSKLGINVFWFYSISISLIIIEVTYSRLPFLHNEVCEKVTVSSWYCLLWQL